MDLDNFRTFTLYNRALVSENKKKIERLSFLVGNIYSIETARLYKFSEIRRRTFVPIIKNNNSMDTNDLQKGTLYLNGECIDIEKLEWNAHPAFKGVYLKHLIKGESTGNQLSCHLVRIDPECEIGLHNHAGKSELHEVMDGFGECILEETTLQYRKGNVGFIPADKYHIVKAGRERLFLLAKFFPALL
jgi:quercetin dioxygenase-like cupin family protein